MKSFYKFISSYATGLLIGATVFGGITYASTGVKLIDASYANIRINVDGKTIPTQAEPFIYNKNVYVPVSTISHGLGATVKWDGTKHQVIITDKNAPQLQTGILEYYGTPIFWYPQTHSVLYQNQLYLSPIALATMLDKPFYLDPKTDNFYIGTGPDGHMPLINFTDVRDYGDFAKYVGGGIGPMTGWSDGPAKIAGTAYPSANGQSIVWASQTKGSVVPGVTYNLNGGYTNLSGLFGVDDASGSNTKIQLTITGDGKVLYQSPWMAKGQKAIPVVVDVANTKLLNVAFSVETASGAVYTEGQALPSGLVVDADFLDVSVQ